MGSDPAWRMSPPITYIACTTFSSDSLSPVDDPERHSFDSADTGDKDNLAAAGFASRNPIPPSPKEKCENIVYKLLKTSQEEALGRSFLPAIPPADLSLRAPPKCHCKRISKLVETCLHKYVFLRQLLQGYSSSHREHNHCKPHWPMGLSTDAIITLVGVAVALPPTLFILWKCFWPRREGGAVVVASPFEPGVYLMTAHLELRPAVDGPRLRRGSGNT
ncbi:hypothetical protein F5Y15DRAFT_395248 [Xylariaceae sp. FL0016]|nr:hypothetical protein F5Y15DRAFT_395248 [Xylariaceae sp. FL0016]